MVYAAEPSAFACDAGCVGRDGACCTGWVWGYDEAAGYEDAADVPELRPNCCGYPARMSGMYTSGPLQSGIVATVAGVSLARSLRALIAAQVANKEPNA